MRIARGGSLGRAHVSSVVADPCPHRRRHAATAARPARVRFRIRSRSDAPIKPATVQTADDDGPQRAGWPSFAKTLSCNGSGIGPHSSAWFRSELQTAPVRAPEVRYRTFIEPESGGPAVRTFLIIAAVMCRTGRSGTEARSGGDPGIGRVRGAPG